MKWSCVWLVLVACDKGEPRKAPAPAPAKTLHTQHAPIDPSFELAIVVPETMESVESDFVTVERSFTYGSREAWARDEQIHNKSYVVGEPSVDGDAWVVDLTERRDGTKLRTWFRTLGDHLAITCTAFGGLREPAAEEVAHARKVCMGTQQVSGGIYVPIRLSRIERPTKFRLSLSGEPISMSMEIERRARSPAWRFDPKGEDGKQHQLESGELDDGRWYLRGGKAPTINDDGVFVVNGPMRYDVVARRGIGGNDLVCFAGGTDEMRTRRELSLCLELEAP